MMKSKIRDDYEYLRIGYDEAIAALMKLGMSEADADDYLFSSETPYDDDEERRLKFMERGF